MKISVPGWEIATDKWLDLVTGFILGILITVFILAVTGLL